MKDTLCVLNYHGIESRKDEFFWHPGEKAYALSTETFQLQLDQLRDVGLGMISLNELGEWLNAEDGGGKRILLTFDDGHLSHFRYVAPELKERNLNGIFFIPTGLVGKKDSMGWTELRQLVKEGFNVGSHGHRHIPLTQLLQRELETELELSKKMLEDRLGIEVSSFSVPRGFFHPRIRRAAKRAGYRYVFTSQFDLNRKGSDPFSLRRLALRPEISLRRFSELLQGGLGIQRYSEKLKDLARRFVPPAFYENLTEMIR